MENLDGSILSRSSDLLYQSLWVSTVLRPCIIKRRTNLAAKTKTASNCGLWLWSWLSSCLLALVVVVQLPSPLPPEDRLHCPRLWLAAEWRTRALPCMLPERPLTQSQPRFTESAAGRDPWLQSSSFFSRPCCTRHPSHPLR